MSRQLTGGEWLAVPLRDGKWAPGLVARVGRRGVLFGYFFGPATREIPSLRETTDLRPDGAALVGMFGDLGIREGTWAILGRSESWDPANWPFPQFVRTDSLSGQVTLIKYSESDLVTSIRENRVDKAGSVGKPQDGLMGEGYVRERLARLLEG